MITTNYYCLLMITTNYSNDKNQLFNLIIWLLLVMVDLSLLQMEKVSSTDFLEHKCVWSSLLCQNLTEWWHSVVHSSTLPTDWIVQLPMPFGCIFLTNGSTMAFLWTIEIYVLWIPIAVWQINQKKHPSQSWRFFTRKACGSRQPRNVSCSTQWALQ